MVIVVAIGQLIGKGNTAEVYLWGNSDVIKIFDQHIPERLIKNEYDTNLQIQYLQLPSPMAKGIIEVEGKKGIIYKKLEGENLTNLLTRNPFAIKKNAKLFSQLHFQIHQKDGNNLPKQIEYLIRNIQMTDLLTNEEKQSICQYLCSLPEGNQVCHGDFHPDNILVSKDQVKVIDWMTGSSGNPLGDIAKAFIIIKYAYLPKSMPNLTRMLLEVFRDYFCKYYLEEYEKLAGISREEIEKWNLPIMASRLSEAIHPDEKKVLLHVIRSQYKEYIHN